MEKINIDKIENHWNFAPFECYANCILSLLKFWDLHPGNFFIQYWFLNYDQLILSSKHPRLNYLDYYYGLEYKFFISSNHAIVECLDSGAVALLYCDTKSLFYYPDEYSGAGDMGLMHFIIIYGYDSGKQCFYVLDPTVDFNGIISYSDVDKLIFEVENQIFIRCKKTNLSKPNENKVELFKQSSRQSYLVYHLAENSCGMKATENFVKDIEVCSEWNEDKLKDWLFFNCVSLTTIVKNRSTIKSYFESSGVLKPSDWDRCSELFNNVIKNWNATNFLMTKLRMKRDFKLTENLKSKLQIVQKAESRLLDELYQIGKNL